MRGISYLRPMAAALGLLLGTAGPSASWADPNDGALPRTDDPADLLVVDFDDPRGTALDQVEVRVGPGINPMVDTAWNDSFQGSQTTGNGANRLQRKPEGTANAYVSLDGFYVDRSAGVSGHHDSGLPRDRQIDL